MSLKNQLLSLVILPFGVSMAHAASIEKTSIPPEPPMAPPGVETPAPKAKQEKIDKSLDQYWREAGVRLDHLVKDEMISVRNCNRAEVYFQACFDTLRAIAGRGAPGPFDVLPSSIVNEESLGEFVVLKELEFGFSFVAIKTNLENTKGKSLRVITAEKQEKIRSIRSAVKSLFESMQAEKAKARKDRSRLEEKMNVDFPKLLDEVLAQVKPTISEESFASMLAAGINAYMGKAVDPHARIESLARFRDNQQNTGEKFTGIGASMKIVGDNPVFVDISRNSPALKFGVQRNDTLLAIDGVMTKKMDLDLVAKRIRGPEGTLVRLDIQRNSEYVQLEIVRGQIISENIEVVVAELLGHKFVIARIESFIDEKATTTLKAKLSEALKDRSIEGVIVDLRGNGGGLLEEGIGVSSLFVGRKVVVMKKSLNGKSAKTFWGPEKAITDLPMVTLINGNSASASEIFAGAVQDHQRSWIVGERSFGKGTVQTGNTTDGKILNFVTTDRFYQPSGRTNQVVGIEPDFEVPTRPDATEDERYSVRESDVYPEALPWTGKSWVQSRPAQVKEIKDCLSAGRAKSSFESLKASEGADYQLLSAAEVISCSMGGAPKAVGDTPKAVTNAAANTP